MQALKKECKINQKELCPQTQKHNVKSICLINQPTVGMKNLGQSYLEKCILQRISKRWLVKAICFSGAFNPTSVCRDGITLGLHSHKTSELQAGVCVPGESKGNQTTGSVQRKRLSFSFAVALAQLERERPTVEHLDTLQMDGSRQNTSSRQPICITELHNVTITKHAAWDFCSAFIAG